jgi:hypothetical protein
MNTLGNGVRGIHVQSQHRAPKMTSIPQSKLGPRTTSFADSEGVYGLLYWYIIVGYTREVLIYCISTVGERVEECVISCEAET